MIQYIKDIELIMLAIRQKDYKDALIMLQDVKEEMIIQDALNNDA
jgi:ribosomal protein L22